MNWPMCPLYLNNRPCIDCTLVKPVKLLYPIDASAGSAQWIILCFHYAPLSRCLSRRPVPTWTRPQSGQVHYIHAVEVSHDSVRS